MLTNQLNDTRTYQVRRQTHTEVNRLLAAAVVSRKFCSLLLSNPAAALEQGFAGEYFNLSVDEHQAIRSIHCSSLTEFAQQLEKSLFATPAIPLRSQSTDGPSVNSWPI